MARDLNRESRARLIGTGNAYAYLQALYPDLKDDFYQRILSESDSHKRDLIHAEMCALETLKTYIDQDYRHYKTLEEKARHG